MNVTDVAEKIQNKIRLLNDTMAKLEACAQQRAESIAEYEKAVSLTLIKLKNGIEIELEGQTIQNPGATISEKIAKGICWEQKLTAEKTDANYKNLSKRLDAITAQLNGYQSIYKHLGVVNRG